MEGDNDDDDELTFVTLLAATRNVVQWLKLQKQNGKHSKDEPDAGNGNEKKGAKHRRNIDCELSEEIALRK